MWDVVCYIGSVFAGVWSGIFFLDWVVHDVMSDVCEFCCGLWLCLILFLMSKL